MKIKWIGKYDGKNLPTVDVEVGAKELPEVHKQVCNHDLFRLFFCLLVVFISKKLILEGSHFQELIG